ncbi:MAG TPA: TlpA disulfide reductase family protein [Candidatus Acidoferrum sp.]|nr:TlpA disulfide reductase family protein [Candidatus Acidoferrum sp.]
MKTLRKYLLVLGFAGIGLAGCTQHPVGSSPVAAAAAAAGPGEMGSAMPAFDLKDLRGKKLLSDNLRGKVVLIDFWATWCGPCKKEMPGYQKLQDEY